MKNPFIISEKKNKYMKILLYGNSGAGKTHFALTFPDVAIIDLEGGTDFFGNRFQFSVLDTKSFSDVLNAVKFLETEKHDFKTLVIDPITIIWSALQDGRLEFKMRNTDKATRGEEKILFNYSDWGQLKRFYNMLMTKLINLPMHIILISRLKDEYDMTNGEMTKIGVKPDAEKSTVYTADIVFQLVALNNKRIAIFNKDRTGHFEIESKIENPSYSTFKRLIESSNVNGPMPKHHDEIEAAKADSELFMEKSDYEKKSVETINQTRDTAINFFASKNIDQSQILYFLNKKTIEDISLSDIDVLRDIVAKSLKDPLILNQFKTNNDISTLIEQIKKLANDDNIDFQSILESLNVKTLDMIGEPALDDMINKWHIIKQSFKKIKKNEKDLPWEDPVFKITENFAITESDISAYCNIQDLGELTPELLENLNTVLKSLELGMITEAKFKEIAAARFEMKRESNKNNLL